MDRTSKLGLCQAPRKADQRHLFSVFLLILVLSLPGWAVDEKVVLDIGGVVRTAWVYGPGDLSPGERLPLVLAFHGSSWNAQVMRRTTGFDALADAEGFFVVYPEGSGPGDVHSWNALSCCSFALEAGVDDLEFVRRLLDELEVRYPVDPKRIYATGFSNGGMMTHLLGTELTERFAAIAVVAGGMFGTEPMPSVSLPVLIIHGTGDIILPYDGGWGALRTLSGKLNPILPVTETVTFWLETNGCNTEPERAAFRNVIVRTYSGCPSGADVVLYTLLDGDHSWPMLTQASPDALLADPSGDLLSLLSSDGPLAGAADDVPWDLFETGIDASDVVWSFFQGHARTD